MFFDQSFSTELSPHSSEVGHDVWRNDNVVEHNRWHQCFFDFFNHFGCSGKASRRRSISAVSRGDFHFSIGVNRGFFSMLTLEQVPQLAFLLGLSSLAGSAATGSETSSSMAGAVSAAASEATSSTSGSGSDASSATSALHLPVHLERVLILLVQFWGISETSSTTGSAS